MEGGGIRSGEASGAAPTIGVIPTKMSGPSILIADDYDDNRELLRLMLETEGYRIREARDGLEALDAARAEVPALALIDLSMPALDGWGTLRELRADERTRHVPCVAVTAFASTQDRQRVLDAGFDAYISKPYSAKTLIEMVHRLVQPDGQKDGNSSDGRLTAAPPPVIIGTPEPEPQA
jgi:two-component system, cell cycle response regulator DivK